VRRAPALIPAAFDPEQHCRHDKATTPAAPPPRPTLLRMQDGAVIDFPVPVLSPDARRWAATVWPDPSQPEGWGRALWWAHPWRAGYQPVALAYSDVIEFGVDVPVRGRARRRFFAVRWYGVLLGQRPGGLLVHGPHPTATAAHRTADELRATIAGHVARDALPVLNE
jgi:hypothetical protein